MNDVLSRIRQLLDSNGQSYREIEHAETYTSDQSAAARGEPLRIGAKALLLKIGNQFRLFVLPANRKLDSLKIKDFLQVRRTRFATAEELKSLTGLVPGSVPPFGRPILPFDLFVDPLILENDRVAFNAGSLTNSIILETTAYLKVAQPELFSFANSPDE